MSVFVVIMLGIIILLLLDIRRKLHKTDNDRVKELINKSRNERNNIRRNLRNIEDDGTE
ncbi:hypothetical protein D3C78_821730 [compost metagenome]